jgi:hypothetical protein
LPSSSMSSVSAVSGKKKPVLNLFGIFRVFIFYFF